MASTCMLWQMGVLHCLLNDVALLDIHAVLSTLESSDSSQVLQILEGTVASACKEMDALHRLLNGISLLDVLQSFAAVVGFPLPSVACTEVRSATDFLLRQGLCPLN